MRPEAVRQHVLRWLDPEPPRRVRREPAWNVAFRTVHIGALVFWDARLPLPLGVLALASIGAHMPARYRNYSVLSRRVVDRGPALHPLPLEGTPVITLSPGRRVP